MFALSGMQVNFLLNFSEIFYYGLACHRS
ncbi:hypothetical protein AAFF39_07320 [Lactococcus garvieae]